MRGLLISTTTFVIVLCLTLLIESRWAIPDSVSIILGYAIASLTAAIALLAATKFYTRLQENRGESSPTAPKLSGLIALIFIPAGVVLAISFLIVIVVVFIG